MIDRRQGEKTYFGSELLNSRLNARTQIGSFKKYLFVMDLTGIALFFGVLFYTVFLSLLVVIFWPVIKNVFTGVVSFVTRLAAAISLLATGVKKICDELNAVLPSSCQTLLESVTAALNKASASISTGFLSVSGKLANIV